MKRAIKLSMIIFLFVLLCACVVSNTGAPTPQVEEFNSVEATARMALTLTAWPTDPGQPGITITPDQGTVTDEPCRVCVGLLFGAGCGYIPGRGDISGGDGWYFRSWFLLW